MFVFTSLLNLFNGGSRSSASLILCHLSAKCSVVHKWIMPYYQQRSLPAILQHALLQTGHSFTFIISKSQHKAGRAMGSSEIGGRARTSQAMMASNCISGVLHSVPHYCFKRSQANLANKHGAVPIGRESVQSRALLEKMETTSIPRCQVPGSEAHVLCCSNPC